MAKAIVRGDREIIANLRRAQNSIGGAFLDRTLREALEPMRERTADNARKLRQVGYNPPGGHLDEGVVIVKRGGFGRFQREHWISFRKRARKIAHLVEYGTAPHYQPRRGVMHPGARPKPFMRPAFEAMKNQVAQDVARAVWLRISSSLVGVARR